MLPEPYRRRWPRVPFVRPIRWLAKYPWKLQPAHQSGAMYVFRPDDYPSSDIVAFPFLYGVNSASAISGHFTFADPERSHSAYIELPSLVYSDLWDNPGESTEYRIYKIELPETLFNGSSIGAATIVPEVDSKPANYTLFCNIAAEWTASSLALEVWISGIGPADSTFNQSHFERGKKLIYRQIVSACC